MPKTDELSRQLDSIQKNLIQKKRYDVAIEDLLKLRNDHTESDQVLYYLGVCYANTGYARKAVEHLEFIAKSEELSILQLIQVNMVLGYSYTSLEDFYNAEKCFHEVIEINPQSSMAHSALGYVYYLTKKYDLAIQNFKTAIELDPNNASARNNLGYTYAEVGINLTEAVVECRKAVALSPESAAYRDSLGWVLYTQGHYAEAARELQEALRYACAQPEILNEHLTLAIKKRDQGKN